MGTPARVHQDRAVITEPATRRARKGAPPRPRAHLVLGSALDLRRSQAETYARVMREHGDVVLLAAGPPGLRVQLHCVFHPDGVRQVLAGTRDGYTKRNRFYGQIAEAFGWGLLTTEGERWQRQRRLIQPLFTRKQVAGYADLMAGGGRGGRAAVGVCRTRRCRRRCACGDGPPDPAGGRAVHLR